MQNPTYKWRHTTLPTKAAFHSKHHFQNTIAVSMKKARNLQSWSEGDFPEDLSRDIFSRIPVKSLLRFRAVSKPWKTLIDHPEFAQIHLTRYNNNNNNNNNNRLLVLQGKCPNEECVVRQQRGKVLKTTSRLGFLQTDLDSVETIRSSPSNSDVESWEVESSIDGLLVLRGSSNKNPELILWNPSIRKTRLLPPIPEFPKELLHIEFGVGFDALNRDYKYVRRVQPTLRLGGIHSLAVYSIRSNSWKKVYLGEDCSSWTQFIQFNFQHRSICYRSVIYCLARNEYPCPLHLVSFNLITETFASARLPVEGDINCAQVLTMTDNRCALGVVHLSQTQGSVWVSQGADIKSLTWTRRYSFATTFPIKDLPSQKSKFLYLNQDGKMLLKRRSKVISYNLITDNEEVILHKSINRTWEYMESLVLV